MVNKKKWVLILLLLLVICVFGTFGLTPGARLSTYFLLFLSTVGHFLFFRYRKVISKKIKYWYWIGLFLMFISIVTTHIYYGQSLVSGFVANVDFYNIGSIILFVYLFQKYNITFPDLFGILTKSGWVVLVIIAFMAITDFAFINESELTGKIVVVSAGKVSKGFINFIAIYWFSLFLFKSNYKYLFYSLLFFSANHFLEIQRFSFLITLFVMGVGLFKYRNLKSRFKLIVPALFSIIFLGIFLFNSDDGTAVLDRFYEASKIVTGNADIISDSSTSIRIFQTEFALERFKINPFFGNGLARASEVAKVIGEDVYFYVSDIGLFGVLYAFGLFGIYVFLKQIKVLWQHLFVKRSNQFYTCVVLALLLLMVSTLLTGSSILGYTTFFLYVCMLQLSSSLIQRIN
ncbi:hypothetical protein [uncultured Eudoraea sp.]|uniref:hypothetical protein n=1 Tax=uncultured Eudoraea sp. TaxID=1035614 RepID=UPI002632FDDB|nr:hypothetical protein [uncultured Eudoraea sp.]